MGSAIFQDKADVAIFFVLSCILFTEFYTGNIQYDYINKTPDTRKWYDTISKRIRLMPASWVFPLFWFIIYFCLFIGMFLYYRNIKLTDIGYNVDTVSILFVLNIMANKTWPYIFFSLKQTTLSLLFILFIILTNIVIMTLLYVAQFWITATLYIPYLVWCCYAFYLNSAWIYYEKRLFTPLTTMITT